MGKKTFTADLSVSGLNAIKKQLLQYRDDLPNYMQEGEFL